METIAVPESLGGERIDRALALLFDISRSEALTLIANGNVCVQGRSNVAKSLRLSPGDLIEIHEPLLSSRFELQPRADLNVDILYYDSDVVVVNKAAHQVVHPGSGHERDTVVAVLLAKFPEMAKINCDPLRPGVVHRLDKGTSGVMVFALCQRSFEALSLDVRTHVFSRRYIALVEGHLESRFGLIEAPIGRSIRNSKKMEVSSGGKEARTRFEVLERFESPRSATLISVTLETGRTHQIRVHLAGLGHSVVGDEVYGKGDEVLKRPFLHSETLMFNHPVTQEPMTFTAPLPDDLRERLAAFSG